ncbi:tetratricopeptide repeat protein [Megalodesulfovibrio gigas]|uniref:Putative tetratricopeptide repeat family protein n=1 Tax=Megalodesulfovibrio gigas (strain ATCC 19364 / DSM 1382 / NCIMB 9332 / VKM B-1759) TaxID=1121448 RepID=T2GCT1_MEGG1|nr:tetratricopeptide repeat protein [Megalodesulfovibrio gigas]AGW14390.1 putative tetratricopeptide repeat family protein [Megalodesulfovibrio gigas DSM 1382 = ATCC 19364]
MTRQQAPGGIAGVYKGTRAIVIGTGTTKRKSAVAMLFYAEQTSEQEVAIQPLNSSFLPLAPAEMLPLDEFLAKFTPEPEIFEKKTLPAIKALRKTLARAERLRGQGETYSAEYEFNNALNMDDTNARANFGLGLTYLDRGDTDQAEKVLKRLMRLEEAYTKENKYLFNEFGIKLRKSGMLDQALAYYGRALTLAATDEHLFYNIARVLYEKRDYARALEFAGRALRLNPQLKVAAQLVAVIRKQATAPGVSPEDVSHLDE